MNPVFAASPFDNPWLVLLIIVGGAIYNWIVSRRQAQTENEQRPRRESPGPPKPARQPQEMTLEEAMRRLLGDQGQSPPAPTPPPLPVPSPRTSAAPVARPRPAPVETPVEWGPEWQAQDEGEGTGAEWESMPRVKPPPLPSSQMTGVMGVPRVVSSVTEVAVSGGSPGMGARQTERALDRLQALGAARTRPVGRHRAGRGSMGLRDPRSARRAFVASLVFGVPKGLEP